jgi:hypothetical protein
VRGAEQLVAMRLRHRRPAMVDIETERDPQRWCDTWRADGFANAQLLIEPTENVDRLDLRCVVGLVIEVQGVDAERVAAIAQACKNAGAKRVITAVFGAREAVTLDDSDGVLCG